MHTTEALGDYIRNAMPRAIMLGKLQHKDALASNVHRFQEFTVGKPIIYAYTYTMYTPTSGVLGVGDGLGGV